MQKAIFILVAILSLLLLYYGTGRKKRLILLFTVWQSSIGFLAFYQVFKDKPSLFPLALFGTVLLTIFGLKELMQQTKSNYLLGIHILRIPVELILYQLYLQEKSRN